MNGGYKVSGSENIVGTVIVDAKPLVNENRDLTTGNCMNSPPNIHLSHDFLSSVISSIDLKNEQLTIHSVCEPVEKIKIELSSITQTKVNLVFITANAPGPKCINLSDSKVHS